MQIVLLCWITWTQIILAMHPSWHERAREEVLHICGKDTHNFESKNHLRLQVFFITSTWFFPFWDSKQSIALPWFKGVLHLHFKIYLLQLRDLPYPQLLIGLNIFSWMDIKWEMFTWFSFCPTSKWTSRTQWIVWARQKISIPPNVVSAYNSIAEQMKNDSGHLEYIPNTLDETKN